MELVDVNPLNTASTSWDTLGKLLDYSKLELDNSWKVLGVAKGVHNIEWG